MIVLNLVIGVIMNSMDESNKEMAIQQEINRRKENPDAIRDGLQDLQGKVEILSEEISVIKEMIKNQSGKNL
jgi:predicted  nucleic acid-binding Zn-ribbon protein